MKNYDEFAEAELQKLIPLQEKFKQEYDLDSFANWFYESDASILRLYNDDEDEIFFKYIPIGSYSLSSETWMWSWFNNSSAESNKSETLKIKQFGKEHNYKKLIDGTFASDKYDGWEFLATGLSILGGIGVYKVNSENLENYFLLTEIIEDKSSEEIRKIKQKIVDCENHGLGRPAFVCQHLNRETPNGFKEAFETSLGMELDEDDDFQAWCDDCEKVRSENKGWNDETMEFAKIKLVCEECYFDLKEFNQK
ncbi:hypothetical protein OF897_10215 [Chryseobacterium formosus]|uniref:Uncharacterized protein n=1 Tax=Chryseobacterium formosus TaxID=1537363 RepID=A0ABT3XQ88_9FLAO|nr:DUF6882 domain-containing protein [Chryseobacterium formosus]MCX8524284.1 hypothetical protein [Chryseobacterium formosus]